MVCTLALDYSNESSVTGSKKEGTQLSPFLSPINKVPCWQQRYLNRIKTIRVSSITWHAQQSWVLFCTTEKNGFDSCKAEWCHSGFCELQSTQGPHPKVPRQPLSLHCPVLQWLLRANSSRGHHIPLPSNPFAQPVSLALEFLFFYPNWEPVSLVCHQKQTYPV